MEEDHELAAVAAEKVARIKKDIPFERQRLRVKAFQEFEKQAAILVKEWKQSLIDKEREYSEFTSGRFSWIRKTVEMIKKLPRELRDIIYTALYVQDESIILFARDRLPDEIPGLQQVHQDPDRKLHGWPEDDAGLLNRDIVGYETSHEAAKIFYGSNTFLVHGSKYLHELREYDHYRSGAIPIHHIQHLILHVDHPPIRYRSYDHYYNYHRRKAPNNDIYVDIQSKVKPRHEMETLFGLLEGRHRCPGKVEIYAYRPTSGLWDLRDSVHHLVNLKNAGLTLTLKVQRCFYDIQPYQINLTSANKCAWVDVSSYLDKPTQEERQLFTKHHNGWETTSQEIITQDYDEQAEYAPSEALERLFQTRPIDLPCNGSKVCRVGGHKDCSDHSWHAGWYRVLFHDLAERTLERELNDSDFDSCRFCPDEELMRGVVTRTMQVRVSKEDLNA